MLSIVPSPPRPLPLLSLYRCLPSLYRCRPVPTPAGRHQSRMPSHRGERPHLFGFQISNIFVSFLDSPPLRKRALVKEKVDPKTRLSQWETSRKLSYGMRVQGEGLCPTEGDLWRAEQGLWNMEEQEELIRSLEQMHAQQSRLWRIRRSTDCFSPNQERWPEDIAWHPEGSRLIAVYSADEGDNQISMLNLNKSQDARKAAASV